MSIEISEIEIKKERRKKSDEMFVFFIVFQFRIHYFLNQ